MGVLCIWRRKFFSIGGTFDTSWRWRWFKTMSMFEQTILTTITLALLAHRFSYDNKADLWSVGTVLFEMIAGRPPFHGENHMDLLRNIQQKAVRLPPDLKVSKECVKLLRILLNRNPLARAGFQDFIAASDAFVGLGCYGTAASGRSTPSPSTGGVLAMSGIKNLGPISEVEESHLHSSTNMDSCDNNTNQSLSSGHLQGTSSAKQMSPPMHGIGMMIQTQNQGQGQSSNLPALIPLQPTQEQHHTHAYNNHNTSRPNSHFAPLEPSPPGPRHMSTPEGLIPPPMSLKSGNNNYTAYRKSDSQHSQSDDSSSGGFVMVEKGSSSVSTSPAASDRIEERKLSRSPLTMWKQSSSRRVVPVSALGGNTSPPASPGSNSSRYFSAKSLLSTRNMIPPSIPFVRKGMLSTSPGTGGALVGMMGASNKINAMTADRGSIAANESFNFESAAKMLAAADDVGRRAINVAHVGDTRAYLAMRLIISNETTSLHSSSGMEEETDEQLAENDEFSIPNRIRTISADNSTIKRIAREVEDEDDEMPFAMPLDDEEEDTSSNILAVRKCRSEQQENCRMNSNAKSSSSAILAHFRQALSCYMKALSMLKSSVNASQQVLSEIHRSVASSSPLSTTESFLTFRNRCDVSHDWLSGQFKGVLERADAANSEITKIASQNGIDETENSTSALTVEELIYNHSLACGKDGAVKQLLGQYENARSCYRSAGLLAETLLMEPKLVDEDMKILEEYVQGFSERINEIDCLMLHQSRHSISSNGSFKGNSGSSRRG